MSTPYQLFGTLNKIGQRVYENSIIERTDAILYQAIYLSVSDIHFQPAEQTTYLIRYRIDGLLHNWEQIDQEQGQAILSRLKLMAGMDIAQQRKPQDGKLTILFIPDDHKDLTRLIDLRFSTFPSLYGEKLVIRILDRQQGILNIEQLGLSQSIHTAINNIIHTQQGFFLVTGPTGSGKTTTLYALLLACNRTRYNVVTIEDPIEYTMPEVTQSQVNIQAGLTFENSIRSLLRQDPDIIMVGEIRDGETARTAIQAALTGHLVLSTLHTSDAVSVITRLIDMGVEPFLMNATLTGVLAQRLIRKLCYACKQPHQLSDNEHLFLASHNYTLAQTYTAKGCTMCNYIGYKGRLGVFEFLSFDNHLRELIMHRAPSKQLIHYAQQKGMETITQAALEKVKIGETSLSEAISL